MNIDLSRLGAVLLGALASTATFAANLNSVDVASLPGDRMELRFGFDGPVNEPRGYTIEQPARIALDLPGVKNALPTKRHELGVGNARSLSVVEAEGRTRLIVNLTTLVPYATRVEGNDLVVVLGEKGQDTAIAVQPGKVEAPVVAAKPAVIANDPAVSNIDFQRGEDGAGNILVSLSNASMVPVVEMQGGKIRVRFEGAELPDPLKVQLDVKDFATPVSLVTAREERGGVSILIDPTGDYDYLAFQADNLLTVSVKPLTQQEVAKKKFDYTGEKLSLNFQDIEVRSVLQLIADFTNLNLVASDTVEGNITLRLQNVPWDQALDLVLKTKGLDKRQVGNVLLVAPAQEIAARELQELEAQRQVAQLAPLRREVVQVNYAKAEDIAKLFSAVASKGGDTADDRGTVAVDKRTNSIIVYQTEDRLEELRRIVSQLDIPVRQVMIEARIVEASVGFDKALGVRWGGASSSTKTLVYGQNGSVGVEDEDGVQCGPFAGNCTLPTENDSPVPFVDLGVASTSGIGIGFVTDNLILDLQLSAMESTGNGEVISQPKVLTADQETAKILRGTEIAFLEASSSGATSTAFKTAALSLEVTPQITPNNRIIMQVKVNKNAPDFSRAVNGAPPIDVNQVDATVSVENGETIVIGGIFSNAQEKNVEKVPFLGDLPFLGRLFRRDTLLTSKEELLIFITPRIVDQQVTASN